MLDIALVGLKTKSLKPMCDALKDDLTPAVQSFLSETRDLVCKHMMMLLEVPGKEDVGLLQQIVDRFTESDIWPTMLDFVDVFFEQNGNKLTPSGLNHRARVAAGEILGVIFDLLPDDYENVPIALKSVTTEEIPAIHRQVLLALREETEERVRMAWTGLKRMVCAERESKLIRKLVKNFINRVISEAAKAQPDAQDVEVLLFELADALAAYVGKQATFDDRAVARTVAAGLDEMELEQAVRLYAPDLAEPTPPIYPPRASDQITRVCGCFTFDPMYLRKTRLFTLFASACNTFAHRPADTRT